MMSSPTTSDGCAELDTPGAVPVGTKKLANGERGDLSLIVYPGLEADRPHLS